MGDRPRRRPARLHFNEIAVSDAALRVLHACPAGPPLRVARHLQVEWKRTHPRPGFTPLLTLTIGTDLVLTAIFTTRGPMRAVVVTAPESLVMQAWALDPNAPGQVSRMERMPLP